MSLASEGGSIGSCNAFGKWIPRSRWLSALGCGVPSILRSTALRSIIMHERVVRLCDKRAWHSGLCASFFCELTSCLAIQTTGNTRHKSRWYPGAYLTQYPRCNPFDASGCGQDNDLFDACPSLTAHDAHIVASQG